RAGAARDERRTSVERAVPYASRLVVAFIGRRQQLAAQRSTQVNDVLCRQDLLAAGTPDCRYVRGSARGKQSPCGKEHRRGGGQSRYAERSSSHGAPSGRTVSA